VRWSAVSLRILRNMGVPPMLNASNVRRTRLFEELTEFQIARTGETPVLLEKFSNPVRTLQRHPMNAARSQKSVSLGATGSLSARAFSQAPALADKLPVAPFFICRRCNLSGSADLQSRRRLLRRS
jgi:hypothetical protein